MTLISSRIIRNSGGAGGGGDADGDRARGLDDLGVAEAGLPLRLTSGSDTCTILDVRDEGRHFLGAWRIWHGGRVRGKIRCC